GEHPVRDPILATGDATRTRWCAPGCAHGGHSDRMRARPGHNPALRAADAGAMATIGWSPGSRARSSRTQGDNKETPMAKHFAPFLCLLTGLRLARPAAPQ